MRDSLTVGQAAAAAANGDKETQRRVRKLHERLSQVAEPDFHEGRPAPTAPAVGASSLLKAMGRLPKKR
jgi:hypothetical protein